MLDKFKSKKVIFIIIAVIVVGISAVFGSKAYASYNNKYSLRAHKKEVTTELGNRFDINISEYVKASKSILADMKVDTSGVNTDKVGEYKAYVIYEGKKLEIIVYVTDTTAPELYMNKEAYTTIGQENKLSDFVDAKDLGGIESIWFNDKLVDLDKYVFSYDELGTKTNKITAIDESGNSTSKDLIVNVIEDFTQEIGGLEDLVVIQGDSVDWFSRLVYDIAKYEISIEFNNETLQTVGEYEIKYDIKQIETGYALRKVFKVLVIDAAETVNGTEIIDDTDDNIGTSSSRRRNAGSTDPGARHGDTPGNIGDNPNSGEPGESEIGDNNTGGSDTDGTEPGVEVPSDGNDG